MLTPLVCIYEDRQSHKVAVQLLILSLTKHNQSLNIRVTFPNADRFFIEWCRPFKNVTLILTPVEGAGSYNIKPYVLLNGLDSGVSSCLWLDTDIIVNGRFNFFDNLDDGSFLSTLDPWPNANGSNFRATAFGLQPQIRSIPGAVNSAVVLVTHRHRELLNDWASLLKLPEYQNQQKIPAPSRNPMMLGDQDALSALIASQKYSRLSVIFLKHPFQILHHQGVAALSLLQRWKIGRNSKLPPLIHAMNSQKPWIALTNASFVKKYLNRIFHETSPYFHIAKEYEKEVTGDVSWLTKRSISSKLILWASLNNTLIAGTPLVITNILKTSITKLGLINKKSTQKTK